MAKYKLPKIEDLFSAGVHFGHQVRRWNPNMEKYIFAQRSGIHIIDLEETHKGLEKAAEVLHDVAADGGQIIFIGTKRQAKEIIKNEATRSGALYVNERWLGGTITNYPIIRRNMDKLVDHMRKREEGAFEKYTKKERLLIDREIAKLERSVGGIVTLQGKPAAVFVVDAKREKTAVKEANIVGIPVVGLVDTNSNPAPITNVIPGNDDAIRAISSIVKVIADAVESGYVEYAKKAEKLATEKAKEIEKAAKDAAKEVEEKAKLDAKTVKVTGSEAPRASKKTGRKAVKASTDASSKVDDKEDKKVESKSKAKEKKILKKEAPAK